MKSLELKVTGYLNVKVSHDHPESNEVLYQVNVPKCLDQSNNPIEGWEKLPVDSCN